MTRKEELAELHNRIIEAKGYVEDLFDFLDNFTHGKSYRGLCDTERFIISGIKVGTLELLRLCKNLIESKK